MTALSTALFTATLAVVGKIIFDLWARLRERRGVAGALAGEVGAYIGIFLKTGAAQSYRNLKVVPPAERPIRFAAITKPPTTCPVFDNLAERTGVLPPDLAEDLSEFYNVVIGVRLIIASFSEPPFIAAPIVVQDAFFDYVANAIDTHMGSFRLRDRLRRVARQDIWCLFAGHA